jgi:hypothetical protein
MAAKRRGASAPGDVTVKVKIDPKRKKAYEELLEAMKGASLREAEGFDRYWESVGRIVHGELYLAGGFESKADFLRAYVKGDPGHAEAMMEVARYADPEEIEAYTPSKIAAAIDYIEKKIGAPVRGRLPIKLASLKIEVAPKKRVPLKDATVQDIRDAVRGEGKRRKIEASPAERAIREVLEEIAPLADVDPVVRNGYVSLSRIPLAALGQLARALLRVRLGSPGEKKKQKR